MKVGPTRESPRAQFAVLGGSVLARATGEATAAGRP